jgi:hypothetical protein
VQDAARRSVCLAGEVMHALKAREDMSVLTTILRQQR